MSPNPPSAVAAVYNAMPKGPRQRLSELRALILAAARPIGPLDETLKWGQPAYLLTTPKIGTTLRLWWSPKTPDTCGVYVPCSTDLVDQWRDRFAAEFDFSDNRAALVAVEGDYSSDAMAQMMSMALTYHRDKKA